MANNAVKSMVVYVTVHQEVACEGANSLNSDI